MNKTLRYRIAAAIRAAASEQTYWVPGPVLSLVYADAVIAELDLAVPCEANGCKMRQIARQVVDQIGDQDCSRCKSGKCDGNCQQDWCGAVENVEY